jgi:O-antigen/teichoic acid export membrane protein
VRIKDKLIRNTVFNFGIRFWSIIITFILMPVVIYYIGVEEYGIYLLITAFTGYFSLLDLGIGTSLVKFVAQYHAKDEKEKVNQVLNTAFFIYLYVGIAASVGLFIVGTFFIDYFNLDSELLWKAKIIIYILASGFITSFSMGSFKAVLSGIQRYDILALISFIMSIVGASVTVVVLILGGGIVELVFYTYCVGMMAPIITVIYCKKYMPYLEIKTSHRNRAMVKTLFGLSMLILLLYMFSQIIYFTDSLVIGYYLGAALITFYAASRKLFSIPGRAIDAALQAMVPAASELDALEKEKGIQMLFIRVSKYSLALLFLLGLPVMFLSRYILIHWIEWAGGNFSLYYLVANILIISAFFDLFNTVASKILIGMNRIKLFTGLYGVAAVMNLILSIIFVKWLGLEGVALGTAIPFIVLSPIFLANTFNLLKINWKDFVKNVIISNAPSAFAVCLLLYSLIFLHVPGSLIEIGVYFVISIAVYFLIFYYLSLDEEEKEDIKGIFSTFGRRNVLRKG